MSNTNDNAPSALPGTSHTSVPVTVPPQTAGPQPQTAAPDAVLFLNRVADVVLNASPSFIPLEPAPRDVEDQDQSGSSGPRERTPDPEEAFQSASLEEQEALIKQIEEMVPQASSDVAQPSGGDGEGDEGEGQPEQQTSQEQPGSERPKRSRDEAFAGDEPGESEPRLKSRNTRSEPAGQQQQQQSPVVVNPPQPVQADAVAVIAVAIPIRTMPPVPDAVTEQAVILPNPAMPRTPDAPTEQAVVLPNPAMPPAEVLLNPAVPPSPGPVQAAETPAQPEPDAAAQPSDEANQAPAQPQLQHNGIPLVVPQARRALPKPSVLEQFVLDWMSPGSRRKRPRDDGPQDPDGGPAEPPAKQRR
eukprot:m51a1_g8307 hypothetical protein (359) ;mRNA; f:68752-70247